MRLRKECTLKQQRCNPKQNCANAEHTVNDLIHFLHANHSLLDSTGVNPNLSSCDCALSYCAEAGLKVSPERKTTRIKKKGPRRITQLPDLGPIVQKSNNPSPNPAFETEEVDTIGRDFVSHNFLG